MHNKPPHPPKFHLAFFDDRSTMPDPYGADFRHTVEHGIRCVKLEELQALTGLNHPITEFSFGGLPHAEAVQNMRLFADQVLPKLQHDPLFAKPPDILA